MRSAFGFLLVIVALVAPQQSQAGTFRIDDVWYGSTEGADRINVRVGSSAVYEGVKDLGDNQWALEANLIVAGSTYYASGQQGNSITAGMRVTCSDTQCGGFHEFDKCPVTTYSGYGVVAIYHQFTPEIDDEHLASQNTNCTPKDCTSTLKTGGTGLRRIAAPLLNPCDDGSGGSGPGGTGDNRDPGSPIVIDLDRGGFDLTSAAGGVLFDIDADGVPEPMAWTAPGSGDAFLTLDRNENGWIDDGRELFGDRSPQPPSNEPHGFVALSLYDEDLDGRITAGDPIFPSLRLWIDADHDGVSHPFELIRLDAAGVRAIGVHPVESKRRDEHGNEFRYSAPVRLTRGTTQAVDVFFLLE